MDDSDEDILDFYLIGENLQDDLQSEFDKKLTNNQ